VQTTNTVCYADFSPNTHIYSSNLRSTNRECVHVVSYAWLLPVTWQRWRSHNSIRHSENHMLHANFASLIKPEFTLRE